MTIETTLASRSYSIFEPQPFLAYLLLAACCANRNKLTDTKKFRLLRPILLFNYLAILSGCSEFAERRVCLTLGHGMSPCTQYRFNGSLLWRHGATKACVLDRERRWCCGCYISHSANVETRRTTLRERLCYRRERYYSCHIQGGTFRQKSSPLNIKKTLSPLFILTSFRIRLEVRLASAVGCFINGKRVSLNDGEASSACGTIWWLITLVFTYILSKSIK